MRPSFEAKLVRWLRQRWYEKLEKFDDQCLPRFRSAFSLLSSSNAIELPDLYPALALLIFISICTLFVLVPSAASEKASPGWLFWAWARAKSSSSPSVWAWKHVLVCLGWASACAKKEIQEFQDPGRIDSPCVLKIRYKHLNQGPVSLHLHTECRFVTKHDYANRKQQRGHALLSCCIWSFKLSTGQSPSICNPWLRAIKCHSYQLFCHQELD